ncbi:phiSA1p31-related protein [Streptomyces cyaneofuscatus]|uniref:phiSA1p31-related protein n=1 Tax=Streptomyces cyaneofuscatus TaxID=66883 RepID=UPI0013D9A5DC|nr:phiSA1p31-related protein [Streptomyces cyaneofuscatus]NDZ63604.1 hypothetical protein [Streptomyces cyaneofuscatus]
MRIELIDLDKYPLVVSVQADGTAMVYAPDVCDGIAAELLRNLAMQMEAGHPPYACTPGGRSSDRTEYGPSRLDRNARVWTDSNGRLWNLAVEWRSSGNLRWRWTGGMSEHGVPLMRTGTGALEQPLDVVSALYAPISPVAGFLL